MSELLTTVGKFKSKVSSTLNSNFSAKNMFDGSLDSCWNSSQGNNQYVMLDFLTTVRMQTLKIAFQGGFVGQDCSIEVGLGVAELQEVDKWETLRDSNDLQERNLPSSAVGRYLRITFPYSTDFYGRVTIYSLEVYGEAVTAEDAPSC